jgi:hypothetical protein
MFDDVLFAVLIVADTIALFGLAAVFFVHPARCTGSMAITVKPVLCV